MSRMNTALEVTDKGIIQVTDVECGGEVLFQIKNDFQDKICLLEYEKDKNVVFVGSREGKFRIWKIPKEWRGRDIIRQEIELEFQRKQLLKMRTAAEQEKIEKRALALERKAYKLVKKEQYCLCIF